MIRKTVFVFILTLTVCLLTYKGLASNLQRLGSEENKIESFQASLEKEISGRFVLSLITSVLTGFVVVSILYRKFPPDNLAFLIVTLILYTLQFLVVLQIFNLNIRTIFIPLIAVFGTLAITNEVVKPFLEKTNNFLTTLLKRAKYPK